jgi:hypothetical protein
LVDILLLCITALVCGVESVEGIVFFGETHEQWPRKFLNNAILTNFFPPKPWTGSVQLPSY